MAAELWVRNEHQGIDQRFPLEEGTTEVGRGDDCRIRLASPYVSRRHFLVFRRDGGWYLSSCGLNDTLVNGLSVQSGATVSLGHEDQIQVGDFKLVFLESGMGRVAEHKRNLRERFFELERGVHRQLLSHLDLRRFAVDVGELASQADRILGALDSVVQQVASSLDDDLRTYVVREAVKRELIGKLLFTSGDNKVRKLLQERRSQEEIANDHALQSMLKTLQRELGVVGDRTRLSEELELVESGFNEAFVPERYRTTRSLDDYLLSTILVRDIADLVFGLGPLQDLIEMANITEIMVVTKDLIYVERAGVLQKVDRSFISDNVVLSIIERIVTPLGRRIDRSSPLVDARLADGSRVNAIIPPLALRGPAITIRKFSKVPLTIDDLIEKGSVTRQAATFLRACVVGRKNLVISGGTGSGKTTLLNVLSAYIPGRDRIVTIEDAAELQLNQEHVVSLEGRPPNVEGRGAFTIRDLVRNALRMRPDRIVVGECRGGEALDMLQAMNTGHSGSMTTAHANSPVEMIGRLETMVMMAGMDLPSRAIREQIVGAVDVIIQQDRFHDGARKITRISEVIGLDAEDGSVVIEDIFCLGSGEPSKAQLVPLGYLPSFVVELLERKVITLEEFFG